MKELQRQKFEGSNGTPPKPKMRLVKGTRFMSFLFIAASILISAGIMKAANVYYDLDTSKIVMTESINQAGAGQVTFSGNVDATNGLDVTTADLTVGGTNFTVAQATGNVTTAGTLAIKETGASPTYYTIFQGGDQTAASNITYTLPTALPAAAGYSLVSSDTGVLSWAASVAGTAHPLLGVSGHNDTVDNAPSRGSIIVGNLTPAWTELVVGTAGQILSVNGTGDTVWSNVLGADHGGTGVANNAASTLTITGNYGTTFTVTNTTAVTLPTSGTLYGTAAGSITSAQLAGSVSDEQGSGALVFATSPTLTTPNIGAATGTSLALSGASALTVGTSSSQAGQIVFNNATNAFTQKITGSNPGANIEYILPATAPTAGQVLAATAPSAGVSTMSWVNSSGIAGGTTLVGSVQIFGFDYPARTASQSYIAVTKEMVGTPPFPAPVGTRQYRFAIRYADTLDPADATPANRVSNWEVYQTNNTPAQLAAFDVTAAPGTTDADLLKGTIYLTGVVDLSGVTGTDEWVLRVKLPTSGKKIQIYSIDWLAFDAS